MRIHLLCIHQRISCVYTRDLLCMHNTLVHALGQWTAPSAFFGSLAPGVPSPEIVTLSMTLIMIMTLIMMKMKKAYEKAYEKAFEKAYEKAFEKAYEKAYEWAHELLCTMYSVLCTMYYVL